MHRFCLLTTMELMVVINCSLLYLQNDMKVAIVLNKAQIKSPFYRLIVMVFLVRIHSTNISSPENISQ